MRTRFTELFGCRLPLQLATLGGVGTTELAASVIEAGGLGMVPYGVVAPSQAPAGVGFLVPYMPPLEEIAAVARGVKLIEFFEGEPDTGLVEAGHREGALVSWQVGSAEEATRAAAAGCDIVVAQGIEAGGHVRGTTPLNDLLTAVLAAVDIPVVAAGGIGTASRVADLLSSGADAVRCGTRFLACPECNSHPAYVRALLAATAADTVLTDHFDDLGTWPARVRVLKASLTRAREAGNRNTMPPTRGADGDPLAMACYAGLSVGWLTEAEPAGRVVADLCAQIG